MLRTAKIKYTVTRRLQSSNKTSKSFYKITDTSIRQLRQSHLQFLYLSYKKQSLNNCLYFHPQIYNIKKFETEDEQLNKIRLRKELFLNKFTSIFAYSTQFPCSLSSIPPPTQHFYYYLRRCLEKLSPPCTLDLKSKETSWPIITLKIPKLLGKISSSFPIAKITATIKFI